MTTRDAYVALLEKRATSEGDVLHEAIPSNNSAESIDQEHDKNQEDHRAYLHSIFSNAEAVQSNQSSELKKMFPGMPSGTTTSNPLIKVAFRQIFLDAMDNRNLLKTASPIHIEVAFNAFFDELEKIAMAMPSPMARPAMGKAMTSGAGHAMMPASGLATRGGTASMPYQAGMGVPGNALAQSTNVDKMRPGQF